ncbi:MAG: hypothetical protein V9G10_15420 [Candidatus Nanopelagicales bacterium]
MSGDPTVRLNGDDPVPATSPFAPAEPPAPVAVPAEPEAPSEPAPIPPEPARQADLETVVIEADVIPRRLRRPIDLLRLVVAFGTAALILAIAYFASATAAGLESDLTEASDRIPGLIVVAANVIGLLGVLALPLAAAFDLMVRRRGRMLAEALAGLAVAVVLTSVIAWIITRYPNPRLLLTLTGQETPGQLPPLSAILAGLVAFITISRLVERPRFGPISILVVAAIVLANIVTGGITATALALSILMGWAVGLAMRYTLGTPTTRPSGLAVATALEEVGYPVTVLRAHREFSAGRRYVATTRAAETLNVLVLDRDLEGAGVAASFWRTLRVRDDSAPSRLSMRRRLERTALQAYAAIAAGAPTPPLLAAVQIDEDAALLAFPRINGKTFAQIGADLSDSELDNAWRALRELHDRGITHRSLTAEHLLRDEQGKIWLLHTDDGAIAASDVAMRLDLAELLCTLSLLTSPNRAVASGQRVLGPLRLVKALGVLQPIALSNETRRAIRKRKDILVQLRDLLIELSPNPNPEQVEFERLRPKMLFTLVAGTVAGYILLTQLAQVNLPELISQASWGWAFVGLLLSGLTYIAATMALEGFVPERLQFFRTLQAQLAASFATLISPPTLGAVAVNLRYLQRAGVNPGSGSGQRRRLAGDGVRGPPAAASGLRTDRRNPAGERLHTTVVGRLRPDWGVSRCGDPAVAAMDPALDHAAHPPDLPAGGAATAHPRPATPQTRGGCRRHRAAQPRLHHLSGRLRLGVRRVCSAGRHRRGLPGRCHDRSSRPDAGWFGCGRSRAVRRSDCGRHSGRHRGVQRAAVPVGDVLAAHDSGLVRVQLPAAQRVVVGARVLSRSCPCCPVVVTTRRD